MPTSSKTRKGKANGPTPPYSDLLNKVTTSEFQDNGDNINKYLLKGFLSYLNRLHMDGEISDKAYHALIREAITASIKRKVNQQTEDMLEQTLSKAIFDIYEQLLESIYLRRVL
ncbi:MAG: hypothetical protein MJA27_18860 [Pseudanabaenales cyanobacterium]|nr:hypothetical protein [Pseudanabaenales cyanobacterium]